MKRKTDDQSADHREQVETGSKPLSVDRRGFLHRSALVIGAFVVGLGRTESAFGTPTFHVVNCCGLCSSDDRNCKCHENCQLSWECEHKGATWKCIECYKTAEFKRNAGDCSVCSHVSCSRATRASEGHQRLDEESVGWERLWQGYDEAGIGCYDPDTGAYIIWSEPGTACDSSSPGNPGPPPEHG